jgi:MFS family permease
LRVLDRVGKGVRTSPRDALIADVTPPDRRGRAFGLHRAMDNTGAVLGPLAAALLLGAGFQTRQVFWAAAVPGAIVLVVLVLGVREPPRSRVARDRTAAPDRPRSDLLRLLAVVGLFSLGNSSDTFLLLRLTRAGVTPAHVALAWSGHSIVRALAVLVGGRYADRVDRRRLLATGWVVYAAVYAAMAVVDAPAAQIALLMAYGLYYGAAEPTERAMVADLAPADQRGTAFGWYHGVVGLAALPASALTGLLWYERGPGAALGVGAALALAAALALFRLTPSRRAAT